VTALGGAGYARSTGSARGQARRQELLERVSEDLARNGLTDFSLRRAARAADTTHKVLLYHFERADDLLVQAVLLLRERRTTGGLAAAAELPTLAERVRAIWPILVGEHSRVLDQAIGLAMYDPARYAGLVPVSSHEYLPALMSLCPAGWQVERKRQVSVMILGALRGFLVDRRTGGDDDSIEAGFAALTRALDREEVA
jgi:DNA-binding transcriptional regulator YbjK